MMLFGSYTLLSEWCLVCTTLASIDIFKEASMALHKGHTNSKPKS